MPGKESRDYLCGWNQQGKGASTSETLSGEMTILRGSSTATSENLQEQPCPQMKNHLPLIHLNSSCHMSRTFQRTFRTCVERWGSEQFSSPEAPSDSSWWMCRLPHQIWTQEKSCVSDSMQGLWFSLYCRDWQDTRKKDNGAQICSKDWRFEWWCMHMHGEGYRVDWEGAKILESEPHYLKRRVVEAIWIKKTSKNLNLDCGLVRFGIYISNEHMTSSSFPILSYQSLSLRNHQSLSISLEQLELGGV